MLDRDGSGKLDMKELEELVKALPKVRLSLQIDRLIASSERVLLPRRTVPYDLNDLSIIL